MKKLKVIVSCANGAGTSLMMKMTVEKVLKELGIPVADIHHCSLSEGKSSAHTYDLAFVPLNFLDMYKDAQASGTTVIGLRNVLSAQEVKDKLLETDIMNKE